VVRVACATLLARFALVYNIVVSVYPIWLEEVGAEPNDYPTFTTFNFPFMVVLVPVPLSWAVKDIVVLVVTFNICEIITELLLFVDANVTLET